MTGSPQSPDFDGDALTKIASGLEEPTAVGTDPGSTAFERVIAIKPGKFRGRWFQFRLRTLLLLVSVCAVAAFLWRTLSDALPYREQRKTMALVAQLGGSYQTAEASAWHRRLFGSDLQNLVLVNLLDSDKADDYIGSVAQSPQLETLLVGGGAFGDEHLRRLQGSSSLRRLVLDSTSVSGEAIVALRTAQPKLEVYTSERRAIAGLRKLGPTSTHSRPVPPELETVVPQHFFDTFETGCFSSKCGDAEIANVRHFKEVRRLILGYSTMTDVGLANFRELQSLRSLRLGRAHITDAGLVHLENLTSLEELTLNRTSITDEGLSHLKGLTNLRSLDLEGTAITDAGLVHLKGLSQLNVLNLNTTRLTPTAVQDLQTALPNCRISHHAPTR